MKLNARRVAAFLALILLSVGFGFAFDGIATAIEKKQYPRPRAFAETIPAAAEEAGIPEAVVWAAVRAESGFDSSLKSADGGVGLFQLTPERFRMIWSDILHEEVPDDGMLYDPATNLRAGCAYLSELYRRYGMWEPVFAALRTDSGTVDAWMLDPDCLNAQGKLTSIPDRAVASAVAALMKSKEMYTKLYFQ